MHACDKAMCFFENDYFLNILKMYKSITYPIIVPTLNSIADDHWQKQLKESLQVLRSILKDLDHTAYKEALNTNKISSLL